MSYQPFPLFSYKITKTYADFATAGLTNTIPVFTYSGTQFILGTQMILTQAFNGGAIATYTMEVNIDSSVTAIISATNAFTPTFTVVTGFSGTSAFVGTNITGSTHVMNLKAVSTVANLDQAVQGSVDIYIISGNLPE